MFVGCVDWFLGMATELYGCRVRIFDCTREEIVFDSENYPDDDIIMEVNFQGFGDYELCSYDIYTDDSGKVFLELNIDMDEEEDE